MTQKYADTHIYPRHSGAYRTCDILGMHRETDIYFMLHKKPARKQKIIILPSRICKKYFQINFEFLMQCLKGTVQRELRWVKIGINRTARINCIAGKCHFQCPKAHHHESIINVLGGCSTFRRHPNRLGQ
jgi:hypothetical protein